MSIKFRKANRTDARFVWDIRNSPDVRLKSTAHEKIKLKDHLIWFKDHHHEYKIITSNKQDIGYFRVNDGGFVSIALKKEYRDMGFGQQILKKTEGKALIMFNNQRSVSCFVKSGYKLKGFYLEKCPKRVTEKNISKIIK